MISFQLKHISLPIILILQFFLLLVSCSSIENKITKYPKGEIVDTEWGTLYCPVTTPEDGEYVLILIFHGTGIGDRGFLNSTFPWEEEAEKRGYLLFSVHSDHNAWIELDGYPDEERTLRVLKELKKRYPIRDKSIVLWGWSAGGGFVNSLITRNKQPFFKKPIYNLFVSGSGSGFVLEEILIEGKTIKNSIPRFMYWGREESAEPGRIQAEGLVELGWNITISTMNGGHHFNRLKALESFDWIDEHTR